MKRGPAALQSDRTWELAKTAHGDATKMEAYTKSTHEATRGMWPVRRQSGRSNEPP